MPKSLRKPSDNENDRAAEQPVRARVKNYITPSGLQGLKDEHRFLLTGNGQL
jgi:hypothetical protein